MRSQRNYQIILKTHLLKKSLREKNTKHGGIFFPLKRTLAVVDRGPGNICMHIGNRHAVHWTLDMAKLSDNISKIKPLDFETLTTAQKGASGF